MNMSGMRNSQRISKNTNFDSNRPNYHTQQFSQYNDDNPNNNLPPFKFQERHGKLNLDDILSLDIESLIHKNNFNPIFKHLNNLIYADISESQMGRLRDSEIVKLVKIFQHSLEYLYFLQTHYENENRALEDFYREQVNSAMEKENIIKENKALIQTLKRDKRDKEAILNTYKHIMEQYKLGNLIKNTPMMLSQSKQYHYCDICEGKKFSSEDALESHYMRRHGASWRNRSGLLRTSNQNFNNARKGNEDINEMTENFKEIFEKKMDQMKIMFDGYVKNLQGESVMKMIVDNEKNFENRINELNKFKLNEMVQRESEIKSALNELKEFYAKVIENSEKKEKKEKKDKKEKKKDKEDDEDDDDNKEKEKEKQKEKDKKKEYKEAKIALMEYAEQMNKTLQELNKKNDEKINLMIDQVKSVKENIYKDFEDIKHTNKLTIDELAKLQTKQSKVNNLTIEKPNEAVINVSSSQERRRASIQLLRESTSRSNIPPKKMIFNAGPLESDNSDEETSRSKLLQTQVNITPKPELKIEQSTEIKFTAPIKTPLPQPTIPPIFKKETISEIRPGTEISFDKDQFSLRNSKSIVEGTNSSNVLNNLNNHLIQSKDTIKETEELFTTKSDIIAKEPELPQRVNQLSERDKQPKENLSKSLPPQREKPKVNPLKLLESTFEQFNVRDDKFFRTTNLKEYQSIIAKDNVNEDVDIKLKQDEIKLEPLIEQKLKKYNLENKDLKEVDGDNLVNVIDSVLGNMHRLSEKESYLRGYFDNIYELLQLEEYVNVFKNKDGKNNKQKSQTSSNFVSPNKSNTMNNFMYNKNPITPVVNQNNNTTTSFFKKTVEDNSGFNYNAFNNTNTNAKVLKETVFLKKDDDINDIEEIDAEFDV